MEHMVKLIDGLRLQAERLNNELTVDFSITTDRMPIAGLNMAYCKLVQVLELISFYKDAFPRVARGKFEDHLQDHSENSQRIIDLYNSCFVSIMSVFEHCAKKAVKSTPEIYGKTSSTLYLREIVQRSRKLGWITKVDEDAWLLLIELRNIIVHNNGEANYTSSKVLPNGVVWNLVEGLQTQVTLRHVPLSIEWALRAYHRWCKSYMSEWVNGFDYKPRWVTPKIQRVVCVSGKQLPCWGGVY
ncbi:hypothetical protein [Pseudomonas syringae]|uniref:hypothetical protein n=1 Tax=Pseudomonas syringae TaxID=317 RepID=UPI00117B206A|nr:hypothetical protein [Pseudomonas syringae]